MKPDYKRIVIKIGSGLVINERLEFNSQLIKQLAAQIHHLKTQGHELILISSGAIGLGRSSLSLTKEALNLKTKQALAATGQPKLMSEYQNIFEAFKINTAQLLVTGHELSGRESYLNLRNTIDELIHLNVLPIINENDSVSTVEITEGPQKNFGDNDVLSALVATKMDADLLVLLTNVNGIYDKNPKRHSDAKLISEIKNFTQFPPVDDTQTSSLGRGGMSTKIQAAKIASLCGIKTVITSGEIKNVLNDLISGSPQHGSTILPKAKLTSKKRWLGFSKTISGIVVINKGAQEALENNNASLLPIGIIEAKGTFNSGELISVINDEGQEVARGLAELNHSELIKTLGLNSLEIKKMGTDTPRPFIHKNNLVTFKEPYK